MHEMAAVAETIRESIIALERNGEVKPEWLVKAARDEDHPAHNEFEWDDSIAGEQYRLGQAAALIRRIRIVTTIQEAPVRHVKYIASEPRSYTCVIRTPAERMADVIHDELRRLIGNADRLIGIVKAKPMKRFTGLAGQLEEFVGAMREHVGGDE